MPGRLAHRVAVVTGAGVRTPHLQRCYCTQRLAAPQAAYHDSHPRSTVRHWPRDRSALCI